MPFIAFQHNLLLPENTSDDLTNQPITGNTYPLGTLLTHHFENRYQGRDLLAQMVGSRIDPAEDSSGCPCPSITDMVLEEGLSSP